MTVTALVEVYPPTQLPTPPRINMWAGPARSEKKEVKDIFRYNKSYIIVTPLSFILSDPLAINSLCVHVNLKLEDEMNAIIAFYEAN